MEPAQAVALYGRFTAGAREALSRAVAAQGGVVTRDLTRRSDRLVVGARATALIASGALAARIATAVEQGVPVLGERAFAAALRGEDEAAFAAYPLAQALTGAGIDVAEARLLAAFDLVRLAGDRCRFQDVAVLRAAGELRAAGSSLTAVVEALTAARDRAPAGRRKLVALPDGRAALQWDDGLSTLDGQGLLPLDDAGASLEDLFEAALLAEAEGEEDAAARLFELCARADRRDAIAPYNLGNIRLRQGQCEDAALAYRRALARDPGFAEARYNLAQALEALGRPGEAARELEETLARDPAHADALFNLAQLRMSLGALGEAEALYRQFLALAPAPDWAEKAERALLYCRAAGG